MNLEQWPLEKLIPYISNSRTHSDTQISQIAASIREFGFTNPVLIDKDGGIIAGHGRVIAAKKLSMSEVPCIVLGDLSEAQKKAYVIADNQLALNAGWDIDLLRVEIEGLEELDFDLELLGFDDGFLDGLLEPLPEEGLTGEDECPEPPETPVSVLGDVWLLGNHRVMCGDSTSIDAVEKLMDGKKAQLLHADPPYGMGKEGAGVLNDNLYADKLDKFQMEWWITFRTVLLDNASAYIWGNAPELWRLWYSGGLRDSERLTLRNEIVWGKAGGMGIASDILRSYPPTSERCLFFMIGEQGFNNNADNYWEGFEPIRKYLHEERERAGWNNKIVADFFGFHPRMADHWFSRSQWSFLQREQYERLQKEASNGAFKKEYDELKKEYDEIKKEFYATRAYFDNTHDNMTDVWEFGRVVGEERHGHATPKPVEMMERVMKSSLPKGGLCVEPFGGSGSTLMGAEKTGRICYTMELQPKYVDVIINRWQNFTGKEAVHAETGKTFDDVSNSLQIGNKTL